MKVCAGPLNPQEGLGWDFQLWLGYSKREVDFRRAIVLRARQLRRSSTQTEKILWNQLKGKKLGYRFRRQHPLGKYIFDFYCHRAKLVVEVDGEYHFSESQKSLDLEREKEIKSWGLTIVRIRDEEIMNNIEEVVERIQSNLQDP